VHLDWSAVDRRSDLRLVVDTDPAMTFTALTGQGLHLAGTTLSGAVAATWTADVMRERSMRGDHTLVDISQGSLFDVATRHAHAGIRVWVAFAQFLVRGVFRDAAALLGLAPGEMWPPSSRPCERSPMLWLASEDEGLRGPSPAREVQIHIGHAFGSALIT
jgi:hypothetical protein